MKELLVISPFCAYKNIKHAGGQIHYNYLHKLQNNYKITHISTAKLIEKKDIESSCINANFYISYLDDVNSFKKKLIIKCDKFSQKNPFDKYSGFINYNMFKSLKKNIKKLKNNDYKPDIIILDFTQTILLSRFIRKIYPSVKIICIEQDVTYLKYYRFYINSSNHIKKIINYRKYVNLKNKELASLKNTNEILVLNNKDKELLKNDIKSNIKIRTIVPFFNLYSDTKRDNFEKNTLIFYGAMSRPENYESAIYFIENIFFKLPSEYKLIIIGNNPNEKLLKYNSEKIIITGFVDNVIPYFEKALCLVAPLLTGAGIKIKILEAFSAGLPVLTNDIGIEGIPAKNKINYLHCNTPSEYIDNILKLSNDIDYAKELCISAKNFIQSNFNFEEESYIKD